MINYFYNIVIISLKIGLSVCREGGRVCNGSEVGFTQAAKRLGLSIAQVSRQITALEYRLNSKLLYRTTRKVALTEEGSIYYRHCRQVLNSLEDAERAISALKDHPQGRLKLTAPVAYGEQYIMPVVLDYMQQYPDVQVDVTRLIKLLI